MVALTQRVKNPDINMYQFSFQKNNKTPFAYLNHRLLTKASEHCQKLIMLMRIG